MIFSKKFGINGEKIELKTYVFHTKTSSEISTDFLLIANTINFTVNPTKTMPGLKQDTFTMIYVKTEKNR